MTEFSWHAIVFCSSKQASFAMRAHVKREGHVRLKIQSLPHSAIGAFLWPCQHMEFAIACHWQSSRCRHSKELHFSKLLLAFAKVSTLPWKFLWSKNLRGLGGLHLQTFQLLREHFFLRFFSHPAFRVALFLSVCSLKRAGGWRSPRNLCIFFAFNPPKGVSCGFLLSVCSLNCSQTLLRRLNMFPGGERQGTSYPPPRGPFRVPTCQTSEDCPCCVATLSDLVTWQRRQWQKQTELQVSAVREGHGAVLRAFGNDLLIVVC